MISLPEKDDLDQEAAIAEWLAERSFDGRGRLEGWKAYKGKCARMDYARKWMHTRKRTGPCVEMPAQISTTEGVRYEPSLYRAIAALPVRYQRVLWLHYWQGHTGVEIAAITGTKKATVDRQLHTIRRQLRRMLAGRA